MSEEILKALMQLFAIITKQDGGVTEKERAFVSSWLNRGLSQDAASEYLKLYDKRAGLDDAGKPIDKNEAKLTSVKDSVRTLGICKKINKTLAQRQKIIVLLRLYELINADQNISPQRLAIVDTASDVFNVSKEEQESIQKFVFNNQLSELDRKELLLIHGDDSDNYINAKKITANQLDGFMAILRIESVELLFLKYLGSDNNELNGKILKSGAIYLFANGGVIRLAKGKPVYYSDVVSKFFDFESKNRFTFVADKISYIFPNGTVGLNKLTINEPQGKMIAVMGASGAGKTTLLNVLTGIETPTSGTVEINGIDIHSRANEVKGIIGYVPQDDLLIGELTVFENLYFNAKLCFKNLKDDEIRSRVMHTLTILGLNPSKDLRVGSPLDKKISGGQRKRLNIALELIREPSVLYVDEPTSGLSSRDSENVMDLLRELTLKGKLIFVVIHQPSSDIYKMFDRVLILDTGGYQIYYDNPIEAITYFKRIDNQINSEIGECISCGTVNPESIFNIIEAQVVDEYGAPTGNRKVSPETWYKKFTESFEILPKPLITEVPKIKLNIPNWASQLKVFIKRDVLSKFNNRQYMLINLLEAPILAFILAFIIRYIENPNESEYFFRFNDNIPAYIFMSVIVALFMGLTISAEEIIKDRKILKREAFLNLSWGAYLSSKVLILISFSAIQTLSFVIVGNLILGVHSLWLEYWMMLLAVSLFANLLGLNISASFNSAVTIYILIPLLLIPQMILSGAIFSFDKINSVIGSRSSVPLIADAMVSRWAFEGIITNQFMENDFEVDFYSLNQKESELDYKQKLLIPALASRVKRAKRIIGSEDLVDQANLENDLELIRNETERQLKTVNSIPFKNFESLNSANFNEKVAASLLLYFDSLKGFYQDEFLKVGNNKQALLETMLQNSEAEASYKLRKNNCTNDKLSDICKNITVKNKIVEADNRFYQQIDPIYHSPEHVSGFFDYRSHFYSPSKHIGGYYFSTYTFNLSVIFLMILFLFVALYFEWLPKVVSKIS